MLEIISFLKSTGTLIIMGAIALSAFFFKFYSWWKNRKIEHLEKTVERQNNAIEIYEAKDKIHRKDNEIDNKVDSKIDATEDKLGRGEQSDAEVVSNALNDFFGEKK
jgi:ADP-ribosylglycohydrolase